MSYVDALHNKDTDEIQVVERVNRPIGIADKRTLDAEAIQGMRQQAEALVNDVRSIRQRCGFQPLGSNL